MGHHLSKVPSGFQHGVKHESLWNYVFKRLASTITFVGFLLLLSLYYGRSDLDRRWDPIEAANEERDAAIEQRDDARRTWQKTKSKYEKTLATNLELRSRLAKETKDIPLLKQRLSEVVEENNIQRKAIEDMEAIKRNHDKLSKQVNDNGLSAERPEYQKRYEEAKRNLEFTSNALQNSQSYAKGLIEKLQTQLEKPNAEIKWLRARLRRNVEDLREELAASRQEIDEVRVDKGAADRNATTTISELGQHKAMLQELRNDLARKDVKIGELEGANLELAQKADVEAAENLRLLTVANTNLNELRAKNDEYKEQSETHTTKLGEVESQNRSHNDAIYIKDKEYKELYEHYYIVLGEKNDAVDKENELQRQWTEHNRSHVNCGGQITTLTKRNRVLQGQLADLRTKLQQAKGQTNPLQEMQLKEREVAVKAKEDALKMGKDPMENDQQVSNSGGLEMEDLERRLAAANQEIYNAKNRNRAISGQLSTEKKERSEEKTRYEKLLRQEQQNAKTKCDVLRISLEKDHPLKRVVSKLQDELMRLRGEAEKRK